MKRILAALGVTGLALLGASAPALATDDTSGGEKITICHATGSETNPYVPITISVNALNAHVGHQHEEDIIPANNGKVLPGGRNLDKVDWWNAGCNKPGGNPHNPPDDHDKKITICHATGSESNPYRQITISLKGLNGHTGHQHGEDIIPDNKVLPGGQNWNEEGQATYNNNCVPAKPPVVPPVTPPVTPPAVVPPAVVPPAPPAGAVVPGPRPAGGAGAVVTTNEGFNVQTAVAETPGDGLAPWLGGAAALLLACAAIAARQTLAGAGGHSGRRRE